MNENHNHKLNLLDLIKQIKLFVLDEDIEYVRQETYRRLLEREIKAEGKAEKPPSEKYISAVIRRVIRDIVVIGTAQMSEDDLDICEPPIKVISFTRKKLTQTIQAFESVLRIGKFPKIVWKGYESSRAFEVKKRSLPLLAMRIR